MYTIIGDIHGCFDEFKSLTITLGYTWDTGIPLHPNKQIIFIGDITDRGPKSLQMIEIVWELVIHKKIAYYSPGNHCNKLYRYFLGRNVHITHGLETTVAEYQSLSKKEQKRIRQKMMDLYEVSPLYHILDNGKLITCHAGMKEEFTGHYHRAVEKFVLYGDSTGEKNANGTPVRKDWALLYSGDEFIVYGHTPVHESRILHNTFNIDTGCVFGGKLTALNYPELTVTQVQSTMPYLQEKFTTY